jgi:hypothetical protein
VDASVADVVAAIGQAAGALFTAAAVIVALVLAAREGRWRRADEAERAAERADRDAAQARLVTVEPKYGDVHDPHDVEIVLTVLNGSTLPIFDVKIVDVRNGDARDLRWTADPLSRYEGQPLEAYVLPAAETYRLPIAFINPQDRGGRDRVTVEFTDAAGLRWRRQDNEAPQRVITPPTL